MADQGTNKIHTLSALGRVRETLDLNGRVVKPHMLQFASDHRYALTANIAQAVFAVIRAHDRQVIDLRGPKPATGTHDSTGSTPGVQIIQLDAMRAIKTIRLDISENSDPHGIAVRLVRVDQ